MPKWLKDSVFGDGLRLPMDRERRAVFKAKLDLARRPGRLTLAAREVGRVLLQLLGPDGRLEPSLDTISRLASVHVSTVVRALAQLRALGFLTWVRRLVRDAAGGWECRQTSNAYALLMPAACDTHFQPQVIIKVFKKVGRGRAISEGASDYTAWEGAARQLELLGYPEKAALLRASG